MKTSAKTIEIKSRQRTKIIGRFSNSIPTTYKFTATSLSANTAPEGIIEVKGSNWVFPKPPTTQPLQAKNTVAKTMWDTFYSVYVTPDHDVSITLETGQMNRSIMYIALIIGVVAITASLMVFGLK